MRQKIEWNALTFIILIVLMIYMIFLILIYTYIIHSQKLEY